MCKLNLVSTNHLGSSGYSGTKVLTASKTSQIDYYETQIPEKRTARQGVTVTTLRTRIYWILYTMSLRRHGVPRVIMMLEDYAWVTLSTYLYHTCAYGICAIRSTTGTASGFEFLKACTKAILRWCGHLVLSLHLRLTLSRSSYFRGSRSIP